MRVVDDRLARVAAADAVQAEAPQPPLARREVGPVAVLEARVALQVEPRALPEPAGHAAVDPVADVDRGGEGRTHVGADRLPRAAGVPAFAPGRVAQHGHDRAVADVLDRRLERRPAGRIGLGRRRNDPAHEPVAPPAVPRPGQQRAGRGTVVEILERHVDVVGVLRIDEPVLGADRKVTLRPVDALDAHPVRIHPPRPALVDGPQLPGTGGVARPPELQDEVAVRHRVQPGLRVRMAVLIRHAPDGRSVEPAVQAAPGPALVGGGDEVDGVPVAPTDVRDAGAQRHDPAALVDDGDHAPPVPGVRDAVGVGERTLRSVDHRLDRLVVEQIDRGLHPDLGAVDDFRPAMPRARPRVDAPRLHGRPIAQGRLDRPDLSAHGMIVAEDRSQNPE